MSRAILVGLAICAAGCTTEIAVENRIPGASVENVWWETAKGVVYSLNADDRLEPGQSSPLVPVLEPHAGETGRIHFELIVNGRVVALVSEKEFVAEAYESTTFTLLPETLADNPLADAPTTGEPTPADPEDP